MLGLIEWLSGRWHRSVAGADHQRRVVPAPRSTARVPDEYLSLYRYLEHRYASVVVLTFEQMEALLGFALPAPARTREDWWAGEAVPADRHDNTWKVARRTATPNLLSQTVAFERLP